ncbi:MAG TPA: serpin family protein [Gemmataceae bacterium]|nr:serpin family protein [Gemmataceae bacterium]
MKNADVATVVKGNNQFAFDLYDQLRKKDGNLFFSPESISTALAMTYAGARGDTADEMAKALHFTLPPDKLAPAFGALLKDLNGEVRKPGYRLAVANALWGQKGEGFKDDYLKVTKDDYGAGLRPLDFAGNAEGARAEINAWVEKQTQNKIKDLLPPGVIDRMTRLVLTNAVYFKGDWQSPFKKDRTRDEVFDDGTDAKKRVPMMHQSARFKYLDAGDLQVLEMPYVGKDLSMVVLLPKKVAGLGDLENGLTADKLAGWLGKARGEEVVVSLPRFKTTSEFSLKATLEGLGMKKAFRVPGADFSGINGKEDLFLSAVVHKAYADVKEEGTEAAASTGAVLRPLSVRPPAPEFRADHPFIFLIRDTRNGSVLFLGRVVDPGK